MNIKALVRGFAVMTLVGVITTGCGGGGAKVEATSTSTTMGQELMDLDQAYKRGIIDEKQYAKSKDAILKRYGK